MREALCKLMGIGHAHNQARQRESITQNGIQYRIESHLSADEFIDILGRSGLTRRPTHDRERIQKMLDHASIIMTARNAQGTLVGIARALTDFAFCCYLSDLGVDQQYQRQGIGQELVNKLKQAINPLTTQLILLSASKAMDYYPKIGFRPIPNGWAIDAQEERA